MEKWKLLHASRVYTRVIIGNKGMHDGVYRSCVGCSMQGVRTSPAAAQLSWVLPRRFPCNLPENLKFAEGGHAATVVLPGL